MSRHGTTGKAKNNQVYGTSVLESLPELRLFVADCHRYFDPISA